MDGSEVEAAPPAGVRVRNVYFEETPAALVTGGIISEQGVTGGSSWERESASDAALARRCGAGGGDGGARGAGCGGRLRARVLRGLGSA
jgi:hypothetical protein